jgi:hypothetical protein
LIPCHGRFVGASSIPFSEYKRKPDDRVGLNWRIPNVRGKRAVRHVVFDTNWWKSFVHARLAVATGDAGCLSLFGRKPEQHRMFSEQITAEYRVTTQGRGRTVDACKMRPEQSDNHWLDYLIGCAVAASIQGSCAVRDKPGTGQERAKTPPAHAGRNETAETGTLMNRRIPMKFSFSTIADRSLYEGAIDTTNATTFQIDHSEDGCDHVPTGTPCVYHA